MYIIIVPWAVTLGESLQVQVDPILGFEDNLVQEYKRSGGVWSHLEVE